ncbi:MAG: hypothetical protein OEV42_21045, partial [Deltaproteobacteria bacterium]|nr:hypothetical protein [Deltaproteobacteria bacterium]
MPVETQTANAADLEAVIPTDMTLLRAVEVNFSGETLSSSAELSIPLPDSLDISHPVLVSRLFEADGKRLLEVVATGQVTGGLITSQTGSVAGATFPGIVSSGTYLFIEASRAVGFMTGIVSGLDGLPKVGALVSVDGSTLANLSNADGSYLVATLSGPWTARALDLTTRNEGIV